MAWERTVYIDNWNWYKLSISSVENPKTNKSYVTATGQLHIVRNGSIMSDYGTTISAHTNSQNLGSPLYGENDWYINCSFELDHDSNGELKDVWIDGTCSGGWGGVSAGQTITFPSIDRAGITITNYTLQKCKNRKLYINFEFNDIPTNTYYRYKKANSQNWETDWIEWNRNGGEYDSNTKRGYFVTPKLQSNAFYDVEIKVIRSYNDVVTTQTGVFYVNGSVLVKNSGSWKDGTVYIKKNNSWKLGTVYIKNNGAWREVG